MSRFSIKKQVAATYNTITRPIQKQVMDRIIEALNIKQFDTFKNFEIILKSETNKVTRYSDKNKNSRNDLLKTNSGLKAIFTFDEKLYQNDIRNNGWVGNDNPPIAGSNDERWVMKVLNTRHIVTLKLELILPTYEDYEGWKNLYEQRINRNLSDIRLTTNYEVPISKDIYEIIGYLLSLRNDYNNENIELEHYLTQHMVKSIDVIYKADSRLNNKVPVIQMVQTGISIGNLNNDLPVSTRDDETGQYRVELDFEYYYNKPNFISLNYPFFLYNQVIDIKYRNELNRNIRLPNVYKLEGNIGGRWNNAVRNFIENDLQLYTLDYGIVLPCDDIWMYDLNKKYYPMVQYLAYYFTEHPNYIIDIQTLLTEQLITHEDIVPYIKDNLDAVISEYDSFINIELYRDNHKMNFIENFTINEHLEIFSIEPRNPMDNIHVVVSICNTPYVLQDEARLNFISYGVLFKDYISLLEPSRNFNIKLNNDNKTISLREVNRVINLTSRDRKDYKRNNLLSVITLLKDI